jgi:hypothetical protein
LNESLLAYEDYRLAVQQIESVRSRLTLQLYRLGYLSEERLVDYERLISLLASHEGLYRPAEALEYAERARARTFLDLLVQTRLESRWREGIGEAISSDLNQGQPQSFKVIRAMLS